MKRPSVSKNASTQKGGTQHPERNGIVLTSIPDGNLFVWIGSCGQDGENRVCIQGSAVKCWPDDAGNVDGGDRAVPHLGFGFGSRQREAGIGKGLHQERI